MTTDHTEHVEHRVHEVPRHAFSATLDEIQHGLVRMGSVVLENVRRAGDAMVEGRMDLIQTVKDTDEIVNQMYLDLEQQTFETLARQQPVAGDLRFLVSATRMLYELERSGDLAVNCVKMLERLEGFPRHDRITSLMEQVVTASCKVFAKGIDALADLEPDAGERLDAADDEVDDLVADFYAAVGRYSEEIGLDAAIGLSRVGRFLERIADHAVNIAEHVSYIVTATFPAD